MWRSIPEILKRINSRLSAYDVISLAVMAIVLGSVALVIRIERQNEVLPVIYRQNGQVLGIQADSRPFASKSGKTYTYSWCSGSTQIKPANKIYFANEGEAIASGRTLSKLCTK